MKVLIDKIFKKRKQDVEQIKENKEILSEQIETSIKKNLKAIVLILYNLILTQNITYLSLIKKTRK